MLYMVFDVESIGLHGEGFAVGYVVVDRNGERLDSGLYACDPSRARGTRDSHNWISENGNSIDATHISPAGVRALFWHTWLEWKDKGAPAFGCLVRRSVQSSEAKKRGIEMNTELQKGHTP